MQHSSPLVDCEWLHSNLNREDTIILDATFFLPRQQRKAAVEYRQAHIPDSLFFDIDRVADLGSPLPHTLPSADDFARAVGSMGIDNSSRVIVYDDNAFFASARAWWMFRVFGHERVYVLDGGMKRWKMLGLPLDSIVAEPPKKTFTARFNKTLFCNLKQMREYSQNHIRQIVDARSPESYSGRRPIHDKTMTAGHIPGSVNVYYGDLRNHEDHTLLCEDRLLQLFKARSVDLERPIVTTCGSGVSAAVLALSLYRIGLKEIPLYDGSWAEWGSRIHNPDQHAI